MVCFRGLSRCPSLLPGMQVSGWLPTQSSHLTSSDMVFLSDHPLWYSAAVSFSWESKNASWCGWRDVRWYVQLKPTFIKFLLRVPQAVWGFLRYMLLFYHPNDPVRSVLLIFPFCSWENWDKRSLSDLLGDTRHQSWHWNTGPARPKPMLSHAVLWGGCCNVLVFRGGRQVLPGPTVSSCLQLFLLGTSRHYPSSWPSVFPAPSSLSPHFNWKLNCYANLLLHMPSCQSCSLDFIL